MVDLNKLFEKQIDFQKKVTRIPELPCDSHRWYSYHILAMMEELGEVLKADKRWKTHRNQRYEPDEKLEEIADAAITLINICIFSDVDSEKLGHAIEEKIDKNTKKLEKSMARTARK